MNSSHLHTHTHKCVPGTAAAADRSTEVVARQVGHGQRPPGQRSLSLWLLPSSARGYRSAVHSLSLRKRKEGLLRGIFTCSRRKKN